MRSYGLFSYQRHVLEPEGTAYIGFRTVYKRVARGYDVVVTSQIWLENFWLQTLCRPACIARVARAFLGYETYNLLLSIASLFNPL